jgi:hypothetical protein
MVTPMLIPTAGTTQTMVTSHFTNRQQFTVAAPSGTTTFATTSGGAAGTYVDIFNYGTGSVTINVPTGGLLYLAGSSASSGARTLATFGHVRLWCVDGSTTYMAEGIGLT